MGNFLEDISHSIQAEPDFWQSEALVYPRGRYLLRAGEYAQYAYLIEEGAARAFALINGQEQTLRFGYKGSILAGLPDFFFGTPSTVSIQSLRKTTLQRIQRKRFYQFVEESAAQQKAYWQFLQGFIKENLERERDILCESAELRLQRLEERSPLVFQEIPAKYIADYLRMRPETLSRLRKS